MERATQGGNCRLDRGFLQPYRTPPLFDSNLAVCERVHRVGQPVVSPRTQRGWFAVTPRGPMILEITPLGAGGGARFGFITTCSSTSSTSSLTCVRLFDPLLTRVSSDSCDLPSNISRTRPARTGWHNCKDVPVSYPARLITIRPTISVC